MWNNSKINLLNTRLLYPRGQHMKVIYDENGRISEITFAEGDNQEKLLDTLQTIVDKHNAAVIKESEIQAEQNIKQSELQVEQNIKQTEIQAKANVMSAKLHALAVCNNVTMIQAIEFDCKDIVIKQK